MVDKESRKTFKEVQTKLQGQRKKTQESVTVKR